MYKDGKIKEKRMIMMQEYTIVKTKKEKFRGLASMVFNMVDYVGYFDGYLELRSKFTKEESETKELLWNIYVNGLPEAQNRHDNNSEYDKYIQQTLDFVTSILDKYVPVEDRIYGNGIKFEFSDLTEFLDVPEVEGWKIGSPFTCILSNDVQVRKINLVTNEDGKWLNHIYGYACYEPLNSFKEEVAKMSAGQYEVVSAGKRFDIIGELFENTEIVVNHDDKNTHSIFSFQHEQEPAENKFNELNYINYDYQKEEECSVCNSGGCPSCDTSGFYGERVF